ncbi:hypothetical protein [Campylobacter canadensis]|uniref:hypothetical protein n=1 Tax=Campylobacter canadensis TaxID=449520 RepID=UPI0015531342|nr:hypothetical protein [Campylobacter canadensis]MBZ7995364.1 hypothetical protein [Campylobacter canadensis]
MQRRQNYEAIELSKSKVELIQELYDTIIDLKQHNLTLTRLYVVFIIMLGISVCTLSILMLFAREYKIAFVYFIDIVICYVLLVYRKKRLLSKYYDWICLISSYFIVLSIAISNVIIHGIASGFNVYILMLVSLSFIIYIDNIKKRYLASFITLIFNVAIFYCVNYYDLYHLHKHQVQSLQTDLLYVFSVLIYASICILANYIIGIKSIDIIEKITLESSSQEDIQNEKSFFDIYEKKALISNILNNKNQEYKHLNVCFFEIVFKDEINNFVYKFDSHIQDKIFKEFVFLLKLYIKDYEYISRWEKCNFIAVFEQNNKLAHLLLENIIKYFNTQIKQNQKNRSNIFLRVAAKHYPLINLQDKPRNLLDKINEVVHLKYDNDVLGYEYLIFCDTEDR